MCMFTCLVWCAAAVSLSSVYAQSDESGYNEELEMFRRECLQKFQLTDEDIIAVVKTGDFSKIDSCYWACYFKKTGLLNAKGQYDLENYQTIMRKFWKDDYFPGLGQRCAPVKDAVVSDGEAGCQRGALLAACFM